MQTIERKLKAFSFIGENELKVWNNLKEFDLVTAKHSAHTLFYFDGMIRDCLTIKGQEFTLVGEMQAANMDIDSILRAAFLHDCGKLHLSKTGKKLILSSARLSAEDRAITEEHEFLGEKALKRQGLELEALVAGQHHNYSGSELKVYFTVRPLGLEVGVADLLHLTDVQEALLAERPYRKSLSPLQTLAIIVDEVKAKRVGLKTALLWIYIQMEKLKSSYLLYNLASSAWEEIENLLKVNDFLEANQKELATQNLALEA
jgi:hypothetical protein